MRNERNRGVRGTLFVLYKKNIGISTLTQYTRHCSELIINTTLLMKPPYPCARVRAGLPCLQRNMDSHPNVMASP